MPPRIHLGVNLNFAKFVYGPQRTFDIVRHEFGLRHVEIVPDIDFGPMFYQTEPDKFREFHRANAAYAREIGLSVDTMFFFLRDNGAVSHPNADVREAVYRVGLSSLETAACYEVRYAGSQLMAIHREDAADPEQFQRTSNYGHDIWKRWMADAHRLGLQGLVVEMMSTVREGCSTIAQTKESLDTFDAHHAAHPESTVPVELGFDIGHGISEKESPDPRDRDLRSWCEAFAGRMPEIHLKDTDAQFMAAWHFGTGQGIVDLDAFVTTVRDVLTVPDVWLFLEVPGKRGRMPAEDENIEGHRQSIGLLRQAFDAAGYSEIESEGTWVLE